MEAVGNFKPIHSPPSPRCPTVACTVNRRPSQGAATATVTGAGTVGPARFIARRHARRADRRQRPCASRQASRDARRRPACRGGTTPHSPARLAYALARIRSTRPRSRDAWIPASAGMTKAGGMLASQDAPFPGRAAPRGPARGSAPASSIRGDASAGRDGRKAAAARNRHGHVNFS